MTTFDMNNATDIALKMDVYAIYLRKPREDLEAEKLGEDETLARNRKILEELAARKDFYIGEIIEHKIEFLEKEIRKIKKKRECYNSKPSYFYL